jgi:outer membrane protein
MPLTISRLSAVALTAAALVAAPGFARQAAAQTGKFAVIDTEQVLLRSETGKRVLADLKKLQETKENEGKTLQQQITDLRNQLTEGRLSLSEERLAGLQQQLEEKTISLRRFQDDANREIKKKQDELLAQIDNKVMPIINQVGKGQGYTMIFRKFESGLIYASDEVDITPEIIKRLDGGAAQTGG